MKRKDINPAIHVSGNEDILYRKWTRRHYIGGIGEYKRLEKASKIDPEAAMRSASWGSFQIMGFHAESLGFEDVFEMARYLAENEKNNLDLLVRFIQKNNLDRCLRMLDWAGFAKRYNGPGYKKNKYDEKLARSFKKHLR